MISRGVIWKQIILLTQHINAANVSCSYQKWDGTDVIFVLAGASDYVVCDDNLGTNVCNVIPKML